MNILELSQTRFSARKYTDEPVSDDDLAYILECVRLAPSAVNRQPWKFVVVRSKERLRNSSGRRTTAIGSVPLRSISCA